MTSTWRMVAAPAVNAAAVAGSTGSSGDPSRAVRGPTCCATFTLRDAVSWSYPSRSLRPKTVDL